MPREDLVQFRQGTTAQWAAADAASATDPTRLLAAGEPGRDTQTGEVKYGDGVRSWAALPTADQRTAAAIATSGSATATALSATFVQFVRSDTGAPLPGGHIKIKVDPTTHEISDIVWEA
jgi:fermentation-respiration switch protein FrsA (DUF1100 family)